MKHAILAVTILFSLSGPLSVLAEEQAALEEPTESVTSVTEASNSVNPDMPRPMHGKGHGGMKHGGGQHGKGHDEKHAQVVRRLDMIEVRLAKIEAMIEILMRR
jgi:hypothetical protein